MILSPEVLQYTFWGSYTMCGTIKFLNDSDKQEHVIS